MVESSSSPLDIGSACRQVYLHPLTIVNMCDHYTRVKMGSTNQSKDSPPLGKYDGLCMNYFDPVFIQSSHRIKK